MKISRNWLQTFFEKPLPEVAVIGEALTFHTFEIESVEGDILDVKVTPNRGHDCLCHRGIAKEVSAILQLPVKTDPLRESVSLEPKTEVISVSVQRSDLCKRFTGAYIKNVRVGPSSDWLRTALESVGQKSINNVVDATNYVMFNMGQPLHAFDAGKLSAATKVGPLYSLTVRMAQKGETMLGLDDKEYSLMPSMLVIADGGTGEAVSIAGIKGGKPTGIDESTKEIFLEAANWDGVTIRKTSQALKLRTDASDRFQQGISPELAAYGIKAAAELIVQIAGGEIAGYVDEYPKPQEKWTVSVSLGKINAVLGTKLDESDVVGVFKRLGLPYEISGGNFVVTPPFERLDLVIPEDLIEEVARIVGYDKIPAAELPPFSKKPEVNPNFYAAEKTREELTAQGYSEVITSVFADKGERVVANKVDGVRPYLRSILQDGLEDALLLNMNNQELLGLNEVRLFEVGTVWKNGEEIVVVGRTKGKKSVTFKNGAWSGAGGFEGETTLAGIVANNYENLPISITERYKTFSKYPFIVRDIAMWVPADTKAEDVLAVIRKTAEELLVRSEKFDEFKKGEKTSLAFRLVFQSFDKTLTDEEANAVMEKVYAAVKEKGWEVR